MCKISVIIPVYNTEKYLQDCLESILSQSFKDFEIILIDDGSTDSSGAICDYYAEGRKASNKIYTYHRNNEGPASTRRFGIEHASGEYVCFVDSDDYLKEDGLRLLYEAAEANKADIVTAFFTDIYNNGKQRDCYKSVNEDVLLDKKDGNPDEYIYQVHGLRNITTGPYPKIIKRSLFEGIDYHEDVTIGEDYCMLLQLLDKADRILILNEYIYLRRMHGKNISRQGYTPRHRRALDNYIKVRNELIAKAPRYRIDILSYHIEYELAVITAMCRNRKYDRNVIRRLKQDLRKNMKDILFQCNIPLYYKICCIMIAYLTGLFIGLFRILHILTGR